MSHIMLLFILWVLIEEFKPHNELFVLQELYILLLTKFFKK